METILIPALIITPIALGILLAVLPHNSSRRTVVALTGVALVLETALAVLAAVLPAEECRLLKLTETLDISFFCDGVSKVFLLVAALIWLLSGIYSFAYMKGDPHEKRYYAFLLVAEGMLMGMDLSKNLVTLYLFFEMLTLTSMPLVLHSQDQEAIRAALKYLFYSIAGAFTALIGIFFLAKYASTLDFIPGGALRAESLGTSKSMLLVMLFVTVVGFGAKAGLYPLHGWLPTAHPVAPAPASAVLSGVIAKAGVLAILRVVYFSAGAELIRGTWVQYAWLALALLTIFMGSMMAYRENLLKKRLAYSTVSQVSYVLLGLFLLTREGLTGGLLHVIFHAVIKTGLFLSAGAIIHQTGTVRVDGLKGIGRRMPIATWSFTLLSLGLIGIPPASGFVSKWVLATASISSGLGPIAWVAPVVLLASALLTAGYLLPVTVDGFFPGKGYEPSGEKCDGPVWLWLPTLLLAVGAILLGLFGSGLMEAMTALAAVIVK